MNKYKKQALEGFNEITEQVRPQAEQLDDEKTLKLIDEAEEYLENDKVMRGVNKLRKIRKRADKKGYAVDLMEE